MASTGDTPIRTALHDAEGALRSAVVEQGRDFITPRIALVLGSGLGAFADSFEEAVRVPYGDIPGMHASGVAGHDGRFVLGRAGQRRIPAIAMQGRIHLYEGHSPAEVVFGVRLMRQLGAEALIITNAAGAAGDGLIAGDLMRIDDHLNLTGKSPLTGPNDDTLGPRFPDMSQAYDRALGETAHQVAERLGIPLRSGVYAGLLGPTYETPAEVRMLRAMGADAVGMSTVLEVIAARHMGMRVLGISCLTNLAAGLGQETLDHSEVQDVAEQVRSRFVSLVAGVIDALA